MKTLRIVTAALMTLAVAGAARADQWIHVHVQEQGEDAATVRVNLPIGLVEKAMLMVDEDELSHGKIQIADEEISVAELRELWAELQSSPDATLVEVEKPGETVRVWKENGYMYVKAVAPSEGAEQVDVRIPGEVVEALLSAEGDQLDLGAALRALAARGDGELVTVRSDDAHVRIWVDQLAESR